MDKKRIREHFDWIAPDYDKWKSKNAYYHNCIHALYSSVIVSGKRVLEIGCATGDLLACVEPSYGVGIDLSPVMTDIAEKKHPGVHFETGDISDFPLERLNGRFDYIILSNLVDYLDDVQEIFVKLQPYLETGGLMIVTTNNPLWEPLLRFGSALKLRTPDGPRNFLTNADMANLAWLSDLEVVRSGLKFFVPWKIPVLSACVNFLMSEIRFLRRLCLLQYLIIRPIRARRSLSCSVIIPCNNEEDNIGECIRRIPAMGTSTEIVVVDDGSTDATAARVNALMQSNPNLRLVSYSPNRGKGCAVKVGFDAAGGDVLMILDADMSVKPEDLSRFFAPLQDGKADFVNGTRMIYPMQDQAMRTLNYFGNRIFNAILSWLMEQRVTDTLCGTKVFLKSDYAHMTMGRCRWGDFDLLFGISSLKKKIVEMPVHYQARIAGISKMKAFRHGLLLLRMCWIGFWDLKSFKKHRRCCNI